MNELKLPVVGLIPASTGPAQRRRNRRAPRFNR